LAHQFAHVQVELSWPPRPWLRWLDQGLAWVDLWKANIQLGKAQPILISVGDDPRPIELDRDIGSRPRQTKLGRSHIMLSHVFSGYVKLNRCKNFLSHIMSIFWTKLWETNDLIWVTIWAVFIIFRTIFSITTLKHLWNIFNRMDDKVSTIVWCICSG